MRMPKYIWIIGATGYVGGALTRYALSQFPDRVVTTIGHKRLPFRELELTNLITGSLESFDFDWLKRFPPEVVFHCARLAGSTDRMRQRAASVGREANVRWRAALAGLEQPPAVVYCSGTLMYGSVGRVTEQSQLRPTAYAKHYAVAEEPWMSQHGDGLDVRMARPAWIAGRGAWFDPFFYRPAVQEGSVPYYGDGSQRMSLIHLEDCAGMLAHVWQAGRAGDDYNLATCPAVTQVEFAESLARKMGRTVKRVTREAVESRYGITVAEALCSDLVADTIHGDWKSSYKPRFADMDAVLSSLLA